MSFLSIQPMGKVGYFSLSIVLGSLEVIPDCNISITDLNRNTKNFKYKHFFNTGDGGITFKCTVIIGKYVVYNTNRNVMDDYFTTVLNDWYTLSMPVTITTDAIDVPNGDYLITKNPSRKQTSESYTQWELEFTTYKPLTIWKFENNNKEVLNALKQAKKDNTKKSNNTKKSTASMSGLTTAVSGCTLNSFKYSSTKKSVKCVKTLQQLLKKFNIYINDPLDGWYGPATMNAVKKYQKKVGLKATGKIDNKTFGYLLNGINTRVK